MYLQPKKVMSDNGIEIWQTVLETAQGGFALDATGLTAGDTIEAGTPFTFDETTRKAKKATSTGDPLVSNAKGLLYTDIIVDDSAPLSIVLRGTVYENRIPTVAAEVKTALPLILFSKSF